MQAPTKVEVFAVTPAGPLAQPLAPEIATVHAAYDGYPLGVYTALRTFDHTRFLGLERHLDRTDRSMELLGWEERLERLELRRALDTLVRRSPHTDLVCRIDYFARPPVGAPEGSRTFVATQPFVPVPAEMRSLGVGVTLGRLRRRDPRIKEASFVLERRPFPKAERLTYEDLIQDDEGCILEGSSSNVYVFHAGAWISPRAEALPGITQSYLFELAARSGQRVEARPIRRDELDTAEEAFLSSSTRGVLPIVSVEGRSVGEGRPGQRTTELAANYAALVEREARGALPD